MLGLCVLKTRSRYLHIHYSNIEKVQLLHHTYLSNHEIVSQADLDENVKSEEQVTQQTVSVK